MTSNSAKVNIFIEIEQNSNMKYEFNKQTKRLELDRILEEPYKYPCSYGFILNTLAMDGDELDVLILTNKHIKKKPLLFSLYCWCIIDGG